MSSFANELMIFRPFFYWIKETYNLPVYICSEDKNKFLYRNERFISLDEAFESTKTLKSVKNKKNINKVIRYLKHFIANCENITQKEISNFTITQNIQIPEEYKKYTQIFPNSKDNKEENIICLLSKENRYDETISVISKIKKDIDIKIIDDLNDIEAICQKIKRCKLCITNIEHFIFLCNIEHVKVFGWDTYVSRFKANEIWNFGNDSYTFTVDYKEPFFYVKILEKQIRRFLEDYLREIR